MERTVTNIAPVDVEAAIELAPTEPERAQALLDQFPPGGQVGPEIASMIERALGLIVMTRAQGDTSVAARHFNTAIAIAEQGGFRRRAGQARMSLAFLLFLLGDTEAALATTAAAELDLDGMDEARLVAQRALILSRIGRYEEALQDFGRALPVLTDAQDSVWEARLRLNRGWVFGYLSRWAEAETDLLRSESLNLSLGHLTSAAEARHNLGFVYALRGDMPRALGLYEEARTRYEETKRRRADLFFDTADAFLSLNLTDDGVDAARQAVRESARRGMSADHAEARLRLAQALLLQGSFAVARHEAIEASQEFQRQRRPAWATLARLVALRGDWESGERSMSLLRRARRTHAALEAAGWAVAALEARLIAGRLALELGKTRVAHRELARAAAARRTGPADLRARAWHAEALLRLAGNDRRGAKAALRAGLRVLDRFQATLGATELRAHVSGHGEELAKLGLRLALQDRRASEVFSWAERWRSGALALRPARPPDDAELADELAQLRRTVAELDEAALEGRDTGPLLRRQVALEGRVRRRARSAPGAREAVTAARLPAVHELLGDRALIEYIGLDGELHAVVLAGGRASLHHLGLRSDAERELTSLRFALRRLAHGRGSAQSMAAAKQAIAFSADLLDAALLTPLRNRVGDRDTVLVPTGALHAMPWSVLPSLARRPMTVVPSATIWQRITRGGASPNGATVLVAGPNLDHAEREIAALARHYPRRQRFGRGRARAGAVLDALDGAPAAHIAAHGRFRSDNPMFSSLALADGPLTVYDLERLGRAPEIMVLSACDAGLSDVRPGDELMGLAAALFALGTRTLVASVVPVPDETTRRLMIAFHRGLQSGLSPAAALVSSREACAEFSGAGFVCFGSGH